MTPIYRRSPILKHINTCAHGLSNKGTYSHVREIKKALRDFIKVSRLANRSADATCSYMPFTCLGKRQNIPALIVSTLAVGSCSIARPRVRLHGTHNPNIPTILARASSAMIFRFTFKYTFKKTHQMQSFGYHRVARKALILKIYIPIHDTQ